MTNVLELSILVGENDETWDIASTLPIDTLDAVIAEAANAQGLHPMAIRGRYAQAELAWKIND